MKPVAVFPGQGSQYVGMAKPLLENFPYTHHFFEEASEAIQQNLVKLCNESAAETLQLTANAQPAILTTSFAWFQVLRRELDFSPQGAGGHSLGEYTALLSAGALSLTEAVRLVRKRGELMQSAVPVGKGKMAAVLGLSDEKVTELCEAASSGENSRVVPANFNAPDQVVVAGHTEAVERAEILATTDPNFKARKVIPLKVSAPFHCPLMKTVAEAFFPFLQATAWKELAFEVASNVDAKLRSEGTWPELLRDQIDRAVRWTACVRALASAVGPDRAVFVELGPGKVLCGLVKRCVDNARLFSIDSIEDLRKYEQAKEG